MEKKRSEIVNELIEESKKEGFENKNWCIWLCLHAYKGWQFSK